eukprot:1044439-Amphidinium_carterae.1
MLDSRQGYHHSTKHSMADWEVCESQGEENVIEVLVQMSGDFGLAGHQLMMVMMMMVMMMMMMMLSGLCNAPSPEAPRRHHQSDLQLINE